MRRRVRLTVTGLTATALTAAAATTTASAATLRAPTCATVSLALVRRSLGDAATPPKTQTSRNVVICHYTIVDLIYLLHQTKTDFATDQTANHGTPVPGIGTAAFTYGHKGRVISLEILDRNTTFIISGSSAGLPHLKQLAERMVPLVRGG